MHTRSRSKVKVSRSINAETGSAPYLSNEKTYELQTWYTQVECKDPYHREAPSSPWSRTRLRCHVVRLTGVGP